MRKILFILGIVMCSLSVSAQTTNPFPTTDSLRKFINKWIRNSAVDAFTNLRLNTALIGMSRFIDSADGGAAAGKLNLSDTAAMLAGYLLKGDTASMLAGYTKVSRFLDSLVAIRTAINSINPSTQTQYSVTGNGTTGSKVQLVNDEATPNKWEFYGTNVKDSVRGFREIEENFYGTIYEKTTWANLNDFSNNGGTFTTTSGRIQGSGGAGSFTQSLDLLQFTNLQKWVIEAGVRIDEKTGTSFGMGFGIRSYNSFGLSNALARFVASTGTGTGTAIINGSTNNAQLAQTSAITFSALDSISIVVERNVNILSVTIRNITTNSAEQTTSYSYTYNSAPYLPNTGRFAIFSFGGQFSIFRLKISSKEVRNSRLMVIGDSKTEGYNASIGSLTWGAILNNYFKTTVKHAGGFDRTLDVSRGMAEILALRPQQVILSIGSNDIRSGVDSTTLCNRYDSCVTAMLNAGIDVYHAVLYETSISMLPLVNHINLVYSQAKIINTYDATKQPGAVDADNVHLTDLGHRIAANTVIQSFKLYGGNERYGASTAGQVVASGTTNTLAKFTATNSLGNSQVSEVPGRVTSTNASVEVSTSGSPGFSLNKTTNGTNEKIVNFFTDGNDTKISLTDDSRSITQTTVMQFNRTGMTLNRVFFPNGNVGIGESNPLVKLKVTGTDAIGFPSGTTAQRPTGVTGYLRWNTDSTRFEGYDGTKWVTLLPGDVALGGTPALTTNYIGYGVSSLLSGSSAYQYNGTNVTQANSAARNYIVNTDALGSTSGGSVSLYNDGTPSASSQSLGNLEFGARISGNYRLGASIRALSSGAWTDGSVYRTDLIFSVTASGSATPSVGMRLNGGSRLYVGGNTVASATLHLTGGSAGASGAPLKFTAGTNLTTPEAGAMEFDGTYYGLTVGSTRYRVPLITYGAVAEGQVVQADGGGNFIANRLFGTISVSTSGLTTITGTQSMLTIKADATAGNITVTIGAAWNGQIINIIKTSAANTVTLAASSGSLLYGSTSLTALGEGEKYQWDGTNWLALP